ncbi:TPA: hypothetical protein BOS_21344 [Bos taurus]|nr:TPA: hypothetical protein BOS_21344 [Bos taurus]
MPELFRVSSVPETRAPSVVSLIPALAGDSAASLAVSTGTGAGTGREALGTPLAVLLEHKLTKKLHLLRRGWPSGLQFPEALKVGEEAGAVQGRLGAATLAGDLCRARLAVFSAVVAATTAGDGRRRVGNAWWAGSGLEPESAGPEASESAVEENEDDIQFVSVSSSGVWVFPSQRLCGTSHDVISPRLFTHRPANVWTSHTDWTLWSRAQEWVSDWTPWSRTQERVSEWTPWSRTQERVPVDTVEQDTGAGISGHRGAGHRSGYQSGHHGAGHRSGYQTGHRGAGHRSGYQTGQRGAGHRSGYQSGHRGAGHRSERLFLNHAETLGFLAPGGEEFNPGPETRLDRSELLCNSFIKV